MTSGESDKVELTCCATLDIWLGRGLMDVRITDHRMLRLFHEEALHWLAGMSRAWSILM